MWLVLFLHIFFRKDKPQTSAKHKNITSRKTQMQTKPKSPRRKNISSAQNTPGSEAYYLILCENGALNVYEVKNGEQNFFGNA
ncbi:MAG: hypothetical protein L6V93_03780 [Clostridiales bacterium]|nr:MAG: hypothetical protein L6V93_03780 [Clostridiales bacterium]